MRQIILKNAAPITVEAVVRSIPHQREVVRGYWHGQLVYAKIFTGNRAAIHFNRDTAGVKLLQAQQIITPALLFEGEIDPKHTANVPGLVAIYAAIEHAINAEIAYANADATGRFALLTQLVKVIATHHLAGLYQSDLHLKNFLVVQDFESKSASQVAASAPHQIFTIDGDGIRPLPRILKAHKMRENLTTFFSKMDVLDDAWLPQLFAQYAAVLGIKSQQKDILAIIRQTQSTRRRVAIAYADYKVFRNCSDVKLNHFSQTHSMTWFARPYAYLADALQIDKLNACLITPAFKAGNTCTVGLLNISAQNDTARHHPSTLLNQVVVKRYNIKHAWHALLRSVRTTRAAISWANAHRLAILGIPTPTPIALIEERYFCNMLKSKSYLLTKYLDAPDVAAYFAAEKDIKKRAEVAIEIATMFYKLYLLKLSHGDMKATNMKISNGKPVLIDLDSMQQHRFAWLATRCHARDLKRFMRNWQTDQKHDKNLSAALIKAFKVVYINHAPLQLAKILH